MTGNNEAIAAHSAAPRASSDRYLFGFALPGRPAARAKSATLTFRDHTQRSPGAWRASVLILGPMKPPVFIVGCPRSGTSFLYHLLLSAGGFARLHTQMNVFDVLEPIFGDLRAEKNRRAMMQEWLRSKAFRVSGLDAKDIEAKVMAGCRTGSDFIRIVLEEVARAQGVDRWIDST